MILYEAVDLAEGKPVQYVGVYTMHWQPEWDMPELGFREAEDIEAMLEAKDAMLAKCNERELELRFDIKAKDAHIYRLAAMLERFLGKPKPDWYLSDTEIENEARTVIREATT